MVKDFPNLTNQPDEIALTSYLSGISSANRVEEAWKWGFFQIVRNFPPFCSEWKKRNSTISKWNFQKITKYHLISNQNFRTFWPNGKHPLFCGIKAGLRIRSKHKHRRNRKHKKLMCKLGSCKHKCSTRKGNCSFFWCLCLCCCVACVNRDNANRKVVTSCQRKYVLFSRCGMSICYLGFKIMPAPAYDTLCLSHL